jgi:hypothetical protein
MSFRMNVRMGQFQCTKKYLVDDPTAAFDPVTALGQEFANLGHVATVNWLTHPELGVPAEPFEIALSPYQLQVGEREDAWQLDEPVLLEARTSFSYRFSKALEKLGVDDIFCVTTITESSDPAAEIFATDALSREIPDTRQPANNPSGTAFVGPGIYGLRATGATRLRQLIAFGVIPKHMDRATILATVAACLGDVAAYDKQTYLAKTLNAGQALQVRLEADALARANGNHSGSNELERLIHREPRLDRGRFVLHLEAVQELVRNFTNVLSNPTWTYQSSSSVDPPFTVCPATALQQLSLAGPIEATSLGHSVTLPVPKLFPFLGSLQEIFAHVRDNSRLPIPLIEVKGHHQIAGNDVFTTRLASLKIMRTFTFAASPTSSRGPDKRDAAGTTEARIVLNRAAGLMSAFVDLSDSKEKFAADSDQRPMVFLPSSNAFDNTASGLPVFIAGPIDLPLQAPFDQPIVVYVRDIFGRWGAPTTGHCPLNPLAVQVPGLYPPEVECGAVDELTLKFVFSWDWTSRSPAEIRLGVEHIQELQSIQLEPDQNVSLPPFGSHTPLAVRFVNEKPSLQGGIQLPAECHVEQLPALVRDDGAPVPSDMRRYEVKLPMGSAAKLFRAESVRQIAVAADAWEIVSGQDRRSAYQRRTARFFDPRMPAVGGGRWNLVWTSQPDGANVARAFIDPTSFVTVPVKGFFVWRAHQSSIVDLVVPAEFPDPAEAKQFLNELLEARNMRVRLAMLQGPLERNLGDPVFSRKFVDLFEVDSISLESGPLEIAVAGSQTGLEFVFITAVSKAGISSDKLQFDNLFAVAVPQQRQSTPPSLRIFQPDPDTPFAKSGLVIAAVGAMDAFDASDVRFFWDDENVNGSDALLRELPRGSAVDPENAELHIRGIIAALGRPSHPYLQLYVLQLPSSWREHHVAADIRKTVPATPSDSVPTPRSSMVSFRATPPVGPKLRVDKDQTVGSVRTWTLRATQFFAVQHASYDPCEILIDVLGAPADLPTRASTDYNTFRLNGFDISSEGVTAKLGSAGDEIVVTASKGLGTKQVLVVVSDPAGRMSNVVLL